jgi:hypothetical protein
LWRISSLQVKEKIMALTTERPQDTMLAATEVVPPLGPRVRWGGVMSGLFVAIGVLMLLTALGLAVGVTVMGDPRAATGETASGLGIGAGIWGFITLLVAVFLGSMISTQVTDRPDRLGAVIHGALVWALFMLFLLWLMVNGITLGLTGLFSTVQTVVRGATAVGLGAAAGGGDLTQRLGLDDPNQLMAKLNDPTTAATLAAATGMSNEEARAALNDLRARIEAVQNDPPRVASEVRNFVAQYAERAKQQAMAAAASVQRGATIGSWITFGVMVISLVLAIAGAMSGVPSLQRWRQKWLRARPSSAITTPLEHREARDRPNP